MERSLAFAACMVPEGSFQEIPVLACSSSCGSLKAREMPIIATRIDTVAIPKAKGS